MPWNFPLWQCIRFAAPSLMVGNTTVFKPSSITPQSGLALQNAFESTGMIPGCFSIVLGSAQVANYLIESDTVAISFTGSVNAGRIVAQSTSGQLKKFVLELGGSDPRTWGPKTALKRVMRRSNYPHKPNPAQEDHPRGNITPRRASHGGQRRK